MKKLLFFCLILFTATMSGQQTNPQPAVTVTAEGVSRIKPDQVVIMSRIEHEGQDAAQVKRQNDAIVNAIIKYLKSEGIPQKNIRTDYLNLNKHYNYEEKTYRYVASQAISITLEDLARFEKIMEGLLEKGLNRIDGIEFKSSRKEELLAEARRKAIINAKQKATEYASAVGQRIGAAVQIQETEGNYQPVYRNLEMLKSDAGGENQETIAPGQLEIKAKVTVSFELFRD